MSDPVGPASEPLPGAPTGPTSAVPDAEPSSLDPPGASDTCPICLARPIPTWPTRTRPAYRLYGVPVCSSCADGLIARRTVAYLVDAGLSWTLFYFVVLVTMIVTRRPTVSYGAVHLGLSLLLTLLFPFKDGLRGRSPGKWLTDLQVVDERTLQPIGLAQAYVRNLPILGLYLLPTAGFAATILGDGGLLTFGGLATALGLALLGGSASAGPRWGDRLAHTKVIRKSLRHRIPFDLRGVVCTQCAYDLQGNVSGICPECGRPVRDPAALPADIAASR